MYCSSPISPRGEVRALHSGVSLALLNPNLWPSEQVSFLLHRQHNEGSALRAKGTKRNSCDTAPPRSSLPAFTLPLLHSYNEVQPSACAPCARHLRCLLLVPLSCQTHPVPFHVCSLPGVHPVLLSDLSGVDDCSFSWHLWSGLIASREKTHS